MTEATKVETEQDKDVWGRENEEKGLQVAYPGLDWLKSIIRADWIRQ